MRFNDQPNYKIYREHTSDIEEDRKGTQQGAAVTDQDEDTLDLTIENKGDEAGWLFWGGAAARAFGSWAQVFLAKATASGTIRPVLSQGLSADTGYAAKTVTDSSASNDHTKVRNLGSATPQAGEYGLVLQCANQDSHEQVFFPLGEGEAVIYARIRWNYTGLGDLSLAEIGTLDENLSFTGNNTVVWVSYRHSRQVFHETAGDGTIFEMRKIKDEESRNGTTRPLYAATRCALDEGNTITHFAKDGVDENGLFGLLLSAQLWSPVWDSINTAKIKTTIDGTEENNVMLARIVDEWTVSAEGGYEFLERDQNQFGRPLYFRPVRPVLDEGTRWNSAEQYPAGGTIATYSRTS